MIMMLVSLAFAASPKPVGSVGIGACIGAPSGLTGKIYLADGFAGQFSVGGDLGEIGDVGVSLDFLTVSFGEILLDISLTDSNDTELIACDDDGFEDGFYNYVY